MSHEMSGVYVDTGFTLGAAKTNPLSRLSNAVQAGGALLRTYVTGANAGQANLVWHGDVTVTDAGVLLNLQLLGDGFFANDAGTGIEQIGFAKLREVIFRHVSGTRGLYIGPNVVAGPAGLPWAPQLQGTGVGATMLAINGVLRFSAAGDAGSVFLVDASSLGVRFDKVGAGGVDPVVRLYLLGVSL